MNITFICTGNTCRSAMAEGICKKLISDRKIENITCRSCGLSAYTGDSASQNAVLAAAELGADISAHRATAVSRYILDETDIAVCMTRHHKEALAAYFEPECRIFVPDGGVPDPYGGSLEEYTECAEKLKAYISRLLDVLTAEIVPMDESYVSQIAEIEKLCFSAPWTENSIREELTNEVAHFIAAVSGETVLGYIGVHEICGEAYIDNIAVHPDYRRMGLGERLLYEAQNGAAERKCEFISLEVRKSNAPAIALYEKQGYNIAGERKNFYTDPGEDGLIMTKGL